MLRLVVIVSILVSVGAAHADRDWPVRLNVGFPLGYTWGSERLHGFTWGFRGSADAYPSGRGVGVGGYAEILFDTETHSLSSFGGMVSYPIRAYELDDWGMDWRVGGYGGVRYSGEGDDHDTRLATGMVTALDVPAYLYEFRVALRLDGTFHGRGMSATTIAVDLDLAGLVGLLGWAAAGK